MTIGDLLDELEANELAKDMDKISLENQRIKNIEELLYSIVCGVALYGVALYSAADKIQAAKVYLEHKARSK